jgi:hypothetical protein
MPCGLLQNLESPLVEFSGRGQLAALTSFWDAPVRRFHFSTAIGLRVRSGAIWQGGLLFIEPTK